MKLYYHKTDEGAEYLCSEAVVGTNQGSFDSKYIVRIDGDITKDGELRINKTEGNEEGEKTDKSVVETEKEFIELFVNLGIKATKDDLYSGQMITPLARFLIQNLYVAKRQERERIIEMLKTERVKENEVCAKERTAVDMIGVIINIIKKLK